MDAARNGALWWGVLGGPAAWSADELTALMLHQSWCAGALDHRLTPAYSVGLWVTLVGITMAGVAIWAGLTAWRASRVVGLDTGRDATDLDRRRFMARAGVIMSGLFLFGIVLRTIAIIFVNPTVCNIGS